MIKIERFCYSDHHTFSKIDLGGFTLYGIEKPWRENKPYISCVPEGLYYAERFDSPTPGRGTVWQIKDVPGRTHIQIHRGNWESDVVGCVAVGMETGAMPKKDSITPEWCVLKSSEAFKHLMNLTSGHKEIEILITHRAPWEDM